MKEINKNLEIRTARSVVNNFDSICQSAGVDDERLLRQVLVFLMYKSQESVFNEGIFDPVEFADVFGVGLSNLQRKVEPFQKIHLGEEKFNMLLEGEDPKEQGRLRTKVFDSKLENILYILQNKPLNIIKKLDDDTIGSVSVQFVKEFWSYRTGKKVNYYVVLSDDLDKNLSSSFLSINFKSFIKLSKKNLDELYFTICNLRSALRGNHQNCTNPPGCTLPPELRTISFEKLCKTAGIPQVKQNGQTYETKYRKRDLNAAFKAIHDEGLNFKVYWTDYVVDFEFTDTFNFCESNVKSQDRAKLVQAYNQRLAKHLAKLYRQLHKKAENDILTDETFYDWLYDSKLNYKEKMVSLEAFLLTESGDNGLPDNVNTIKKEFEIAVCSRKRIEEFSLPKPVYRPKCVFV